ncbi:MAG: hypothetical protein JWR74_2570 [Polaromonas sp.]|nr:hypothetical protein [Polaromonas sp.]
MPKVLDHMVAHRVQGACVINIASQAGRRGGVSGQRRGQLPLGAARLAWRAGGSAEETVCPALPLENAFEPEPALSALLAERYRALYPALKILFLKTTGSQKP